MLGRRDPDSEVAEVVELVTSGTGEWGHQPSAHPVAPAARLAQQPRHELTVVPVKVQRVVWGCWIRGCVYDLPLAHLP